MRWKPKGGGSCAGGEGPKGGRGDPPHGGDALHGPGARGRSRGAPGRSRLGEPPRHTSHLRDRVPRALQPDPHGCSHRGPQLARRGLGPRARDLRLRRQAGSSDNTGRDEARAEDHAQGVLPGGARLRRHARLRPLRSHARDNVPGPRHHRGARVHHRRRSRRPSQRGRATHADPRRRKRLMDPITLDICWNRLIGVVNEQAAALMRTSFTSIVREAGDLSAGVFDRRGWMVAQAVTGTPGHINSMALAMKHILDAYPVEAFEPGDVVITNDPWKTSGHLNDVTIASPVFRGRDLVAFFASTCHSADIGGHVLSAEAREVYEEGLFIPIMKLYEGGRLT